MNDDKQNKIRGMFLGLAVGDALGAPYEFGYTAQKITEEFDGTMRDHRIPKGSYTDDTAMALCLADSLLACDGYNSYDVMTKYLKWATFGYRDSQGNPASDIGTQTALAIEKFADNPVIRKDKLRTRNAGNGGIMRLAPIVIAGHQLNIQEIMELARISSRETHYSHEADAGAEILAALLHLALQGKDKRQIIDIEEYSTGDFFNDILFRIEEALDQNIKLELQDLGGYVVDALKISIWGFMHFDSYEEGMKEVIKLGGDTDTNAAIYGQIAGAYYGYSSIPDNWLDELPVKDELLVLCDNLYENKPCVVKQTRFEEDTTYFKEVNYE